VCSASRLFRERDLRRAFRTVEKMGKSVSGFKVAADGSISIVIGAPGSDQTNMNQTNNPWEVDDAQDQKRPA
jgi:hypothetical protein